MFLFLNMEASTVHSRHPVFHRKEFLRHVKHSIGVWEESKLFSSYQGKARERNPHKKCSLSFLGSL